MTTQMKDGFLLEGERYFLFDVSGRKLLSCKNCVGEAFGTMCTGCYRDSLAEYVVTDGMLLLEETAAHVFDDMPLIATREFYLNRKSPRCEAGAAIPFTGRLIICQGGLPVNYFGDIFKVRKAIELEFDEGLLVDQADLADFLETGRTYIETIPEDERGFYEVRSFFTDFEKTMSIMQRICPDLPKGDYGHGSYTLSFGRRECVLCRSLDE